ncbi:hypothetical protein D1646_11595 [Pseudoflavonifractor sp. 60]|uniref:Rad52/Rad22 family DNA repair protein n=1 Tax=Pseudoflavonifractor sp. 60 TaxID=2304576 RepID=UPI00136FE077|nr:Rad52/Rad22 family DNA repair protein [Pseudoflavonifractor sp. 60]NBI67441.1 hypothetical protein [Pseudoflavonifractor sp. 60]
MEQKDARTIQRELARPFAPEDLEWRLQKTLEDKLRGIAVPYVTNRAIQARLDDVVGPDGWYNEYKPWHRAGQKDSQLCGISIYFPERGFITKWDGAEDSDIEPVKGGLSDSMKRAAVQWGIGGRVLYSMDTVWVDIEKLGRSWIIKKSERAKLDKAYTDTLSKMKLTPAPAGGVQSTLTPKQTKEAPAPAPAAGQQATPPPVQPLPRSKTDSKAGIYTVIAARLENRPNSTTHALLEGPDKKQIHAFAIGERSELVAGTQLTGVKLELQKQDTVVFYILRDYRIVAHQNQAA